MEGTTSTMANDQDDRYHFMEVSVFFQHLWYLAAQTCIDSGTSIYSSVWTKWAITLKVRGKIKGMS